MTVTYWVLGLFALVGTVALIVAVYYHHSLNRLCNSVDDTSFFSLKRKLFNIDALMVDFVTVDFSHENFPEKLRSQITRKHNILEGCLLMLYASSTALAVAIVGQILLI